MTAKKKKKGSSLFMKILLGIHVLFLLCLLAAYIAPFVSPAKYWLFAFFGLAYPVWLGINVFFLLLWILLWKRFAWISLVVILLGVNHLLSVFPLNFSPGKAAPPGFVRVLTYNVHSLYGLTNKNTKKGTRSMVTEFLAGQKPDILCIQEFFVRSEDSTKVLDRFCRDVGLSYYAFRNYVELKDRRKINALAVFSRFPIAGSGFVRLSNRTVFGIYADILVNGVRIRVYNLHLESIHFGDEDYSFFAHLTENDPDSSDFGAGSLKIFSKLKKAFALRAEQADYLRKELDKSPYPLVICGDFNDSPTSYTYHVLSAGLKDAFIQSGRGLFGNTYAGNFPSYRIDYILYDKQFETSGYAKAKIDLSDHYPVFVWMKISPKK